MFVQTHKMYGWHGKIEAPAMLETASAHMQAHNLILRMQILSRDSQFDCKIQGTQATTVGQQELWQDAMRAQCKAVRIAHLTVYNCFGHLHDDGVTDGAYVQNSVLSQQLQKVVLHLQTKRPLSFAVLGNCLWQMTTVSHYIP